MKITKHYSDFLLQLNWNYFITCRTPYKIHTMTVRNWITKLLKNSNKVENVFYVTERDKGDYNNLHAHMLIGTNTDMTYKEVKYGLGMYLLEIISLSMIVKRFVSMYPSI